LTSQNAALLVKDIEAKNTLIDNALALLQDEAQQQKLKQNIKTFAQLNADETIVKEILKLVK
jgi:UDP-N-acetylglucosamine--N-acetylmuramyl-(pentapeptide) pyrophosphoryl-undecaprenol N-acetylglucosamine transferase